MQNTSFCAFNKLLALLLTESSENLQGPFHFFKSKYTYFKSVEKHLLSSSKTGLRTGICQCLRHSLVALLLFLSPLWWQQVHFALSPGNDKERTTRVRSPARGGRTKINRSSQTKGHLLARDDKLSSRHKGGDGDKSLGVVRRRRRTPDSDDDSSLSASGLW